MQHFLNNRTLEMTEAVLPLAILLIENDEEREFLTEMYLQYKALMYKTAIDFFGKGDDEVEEAVSASVERMCKYCQTFHSVDCNKRAAYVVILVGNVCRDRLRKIMLQRNTFDDGMNEEAVEQIPGKDDVHGIVFDRIYAVDLLNSFEKLNERERELICMRHIDLMEYDEMAVALHMKESAVRTALSRAKSHLESLAKSAKGEVLNGEI
ncbi:MAG: sigma-70 family RNA polymerase sigma factor [Clostridia bacterium]